MLLDISRNAVEHMQYAVLRRPDEGLAIAGNSVQAMHLLSCREPFPPLYLLSTRPQISTVSIPTATAPAIVRSPARIPLESDLLTCTAHQANQFRVRDRVCDHISRFSGCERIPSISCREGAPSASGTNYWPSGRPRLSV